MALYCYAIGQQPDGRCYCGAPATTEVQAGWHNGSTAATSGGQYEELCERCYAALMAQFAEPA